MFTKARIKLTLWYSLIILLISGTISTLFYVRTVDIIDREFARIEERLQSQRNQFAPMPRPGPLALRILPEDIESAKQKIISQLVLINGVIVALFAAAGYFLSGRTLRPIKIAMDEQKRFIGDAAHELRTPLTALKTSMEVNLMDNDLSPSSKNILQENLEDLIRLESLVESLLELARHENRPPVFEPVHIADIVARAVKHVQPIANKNQINIQLENIPENLSLNVNQESILRLLIIFLDNAIKYSDPESTVTISIELQSNQVLIRVQDQGVGIAKHHLPHIFDRFYRAESARSKGGYGLGLSVAQKIVELHRGSISVESQVGVGSTFTIKLPYKHLS